MWLQQCRGDGKQLCRSSAASSSAELDTDSSCALSLASEQAELLSCAEAGRDTCSIFLVISLGSPFLTAFLLISFTSELGRAAALLVGLFPFRLQSDKKPLQSHLV